MDAIVSEEQRLDMSVENISRHVRLDRAATSLEETCEAPVHFSSNLVSHMDELPEMKVEPPARLLC